MAIGSLLVVLLGATPVLSDNSSARGVVEGFQASLLEVMKRAKKLDVKGRFAELGPVIEDRFHLPLMIATASAPYWKAGSREQRSKLLSAFRRMSGSALATLFDGYEGEFFRIERERKTSGPVVIVDTQIIRKKKDPVNVSYAAVKLKNRWWIIDVIVAGGISEIKARRSEYSALLKKEGLDGLAAALEQSADRLLSGNEKIVIR
ncbi:MAG: ABC transporter substrate-binding protein [Proteobacteria bacterium]|nr:ABC transporter substrate-binding protein [Pseudomonadota bacterium]